VDANTSIKQVKKVQMSACQKADGSCYLGEKRSADGGIHATRDHSNVKSAMQNTNKIA
jgi:hypothetical protein